MTEPLPASQRATLLDLLDRVIDHGVVLAGNVTITVADVDLIYLELRVLLAAAERLTSLSRKSDVTHDVEVARD
ncbi:MAG TPA: gas vesicle protein [Chloroflexota bacterium]|nr:gas vesicle protein [Chloroflexota bacterium]